MLTKTAAATVSSKSGNNQLAVTKSSKPLTLTEAVTAMWAMAKWSWTATAPEKWILLKTKQLTGGVNSRKQSTCGKITAVMLAEVATLAVVKLTE